MVVGTSVVVGVGVEVSVGPGVRVVVGDGVIAMSVLSTIAAIVGSGVKTASSGGEKAYLISARICEIRHPIVSCTMVRLYTHAPVATHKSNPKTTSVKTPALLRNMAALYLKHGGHCSGLPLGEKARITCSLLTGKKLSA